MVKIRRNTFYGLPKQEKTAAASSPSLNTHPFSIRDKRNFRKLSSTPHKGIGGGGGALRGHESIVHSKTTTRTAVILVNNHSQIKCSSSSSSSSIHISRTLSSRTTTQKSRCSSKFVKLLCAITRSGQAAKTIMGKATMAHFFTIL